MWLAGAKVHDLYLGTRLVALCQGQRLVARQPVANAEAGLVLATEWLGASGYRSKLRIWLSGALCRPFIVESIAGQRGAGEIDRIIQVQAQRALGRQEACRVWQERAARQGQRISIAVGEHWLGKIEQTMRGLRLPVKSIAPWWAEVLRAHSIDGRANASTSKPNGIQVLAVHDCDSLTILAGSGQGFALVRTVAPIGDATSARSALSRSLLSHDLPGASPVWATLMPDGDSTGTQHTKLALSPMAAVTP